MTDLHNIDNDLLEDFGQSRIIEVNDPFDKWFSNIPGFRRRLVISTDRCCDIGTSVQLIEFESREFTLDAFKYANISLPTSILRAVRKRQAEYFFGRLAAAIGLSQIGIRNVAIARGSFGEPIWPSGVLGSISHSNCVAAAVVLQSSDARGVGIDIEAVLDADAASSIEKYALNESERALLRSINNMLYEELVTLAFSGKESFYKAIFYSVGRILEFDAICLTDVDIYKRHLTFKVPQTLNRDWIAEKVCTVKFDFIDKHTIFTRFAWK